MSAQNFIDISSEDWTRNSCFDLNPPPLSIDVTSLEEKSLPKDWSSVNCCKRAIKMEENLGRLMGHVVLKIETSSSLIPKLVEAQNITSVSENVGNKFNEDGEHTTPIGQIPLSRIIDNETMNKLKLESDADSKLLQCLFALQCVQTSQWKIPLIRCISNHVIVSQGAFEPRADPATEQKEKKKKKNTSVNFNSRLVVKIYVYFTRLIFELIADPAIKEVMERIQGIPIPVLKAIKPRKYPLMFESPGKEQLEHPAFRFSLPGLLRYAESSGYSFVLPQPPSLQVKMFDFQLSTYQWMMDHESDPVGLNGHFWDEWQCTDGGGYMYYFAAGGEFRLQKPPLSTGVLGAF